MKLRFESFTTAYFNDIGKTINEWIEKMLKSNLENEKILENLIIFLRNCILLGQF